MFSSFNGLKCTEFWRSYCLVRNFCTKSGLKGEAYILMCVGYVEEIVTLQMSQDLRYLITYFMILCYSLFIFNMIVYKV